MLNPHPFMIKHTYLRSISFSRCTVTNLSTKHGILSSLYFTKLRWKSTAEEKGNEEMDREKQTTTTNKSLSFFEGGSGFAKGVQKRERKRVIDPLNVQNVRVPWVDDWFRTRQGFARVNLIAEKTDLSPDEVQIRLSRILSVAPGLQEMIPLLHPKLFSAIIYRISYSFEIMTMLKSELPAIDLGILVSGFPNVLTWDKKTIYDCLCFLVVHFKGRTGAAEALNEHPMRLKYLRQLLPVLFVDHEAERRAVQQKRPPVIGRLYQFNKHRKKSNPPPRTRLFYFEKGSKLRE